MITSGLFCRLGALLILMATTVAAQADLANWNAVKALNTGTQVRVAAGSRTVRGAIDRTTDDALIVTSGKGQETFNRQEVSVVSERKPGHRQRNALIGLAAGTGVGLGAGIASRSGPNQLHIVSNGAVVAVGVVVGAVVGTIVGVLIPTGGWREIYKK